MNERTRGILLMLASVLLFTVVHAMVKYLGGSVSSWAKAFYRSILALVSLLAWFLIRRNPFRVYNLPVLVIRGVVGGLALAFSFWTVELKGLSSSIFYLYSYPIFAPIVTSLFYREPFEKTLIVPLLVSVIGIFFLAGHPGSFSFGFGDLTGILSGVLGGIAIASVREGRKKNESDIVYLSFIVFSIPVTTAGILLIPGESFIIPQAPRPDLAAIWISLMVLGTAATFAQMSMTEAYKVLTTQTGPLISLLQVPLTALIAFLLFNEKPTWSVLTGGALILLGAALSIYMRRSRGIRPG